MYNKDILKIVHVIYKEVKIWHITDKLILGPLFVKGDNR